MGAEKGADIGEVVGTACGREGRDATQPRKEQQEIMGGAAGKGGKEAGEILEVDIHLVLKRRKLVKAGGIVPAKENVAAEEMRSPRDMIEQEGGEPEKREGSAVPGPFWLGDEGEEGQAVLPLVLVPFEPITKEEPTTRRKQATKMKRL